MPTRATIVHLDPDASTQWREPCAVVGARPLKRTIQKEIVQPLALRILHGGFPESNAVTIEAENGRLVFPWEPALEVVPA